jgi:hypothetical protein
MPLKSLSSFTFAFCALAVVGLLSFCSDNRQIARAGISGSTPFLPSSAVNQPIPANPPIHPDSTSMIQNNSNWVLPSSSPYKEWLGPRKRTQYEDIVFASTPLVNMYVNYKDATGYGCATTPIAVPMPADVQTVFTSMPIDQDGTTWIVDENGNSWEGFAITPPGTASRDIACDSNRWNALRYDYWPAEEASGLGYGHGKGASASHIQTGAGLIRPQNTQLPTGSNFGHALRINACLGADGTYAGHPKYVYPAMGGDGAISGAAGIPYGARIQLDPSLDVESWASVNAKAEPWREGLKKILRTLQVYGAIVVDHSCPQGSGGLETSNGYTALPYVFPWEAAGYGWGYLDGVPYDLMSRFRVIDWRLWTGTASATVSAPTNTALPVLSGTPQVGSQLTASNGSWSGSPTAYAYQWRRCDSAGASCVAVSGATNSSYLLASADQGATLRIAVTASNGSGSSTAVSTPTAAVTAPTVAPTNTALPVLSGAPQVGSQLTASNGSWSGSPTAYAYQWNRCDSAGASCVAVSGATNSSYLLASADQGATLRIAVTASNGSGSSTAVSAPTASVVAPAVAPANTVLPVVSGTLQVGSQLTASNGSWSGSPTAYAYQWNRCDSAGANCAAVSGATNGSYLLASADQGSTVRVAVTASNGSGSTTAVSAATGSVVVPAVAPANTALPAIFGRARQGQTLTASAGTWSGSPTSYAFKWLRCDTSGANCAAVSGATNTTYSLGSSDVGSTLRVVVIASNSGGSASATSPPTAVVTKRYRRS